VSYISKQLPSGCLRSGCWDQDQESRNNAFYFVYLEVQEQPPIIITSRCFEEVLHWDGFNFWKKELQTRHEPATELCLINLSAKYCQHIPPAESKLTNQRAAWQKVKIQIP
jgi:hypothetical protein